MPGEPRSNNRKTQIIAATEQLLRRKGLAGVTTRAIAAAVPCSEGAIYVHFKGRLELLLAVLEASLPDMLVPLRGLQEEVGKGTPRKNLTRAVEGLQKFHDRVTPMLGSLFAEPELLDAFRKTLAQKGKGPAGGIARIADYIESEQKLGRISPAIDATNAATALMSASFFQSFTTALLGKPVQHASAKQMVKSVL